MSQTLRPGVIIALFGSLLLAAWPSSAPAAADSTGRRVGQFFSGAGNLIYLGVGAGVPLLEDGRLGERHVMRTLDALGTSVLFSEALKRLTREKRPDAAARDSFPSGHATAAFAVAATETAFHPGQSLFWYGGATLIAGSRVTLHRHYIHDVLAGAGLGYGTARAELSQRRSLILAPLIEPNPRPRLTVAPVIAPLHREIGLLITRAF